MKRKLFRPAIALLGISLLITGCRKSETTIEKETVATVATESLEQTYGCTHTKSLLSYHTWPAVGLLRMFMIKNQEDFDRLVKGATCSPIIDFEKYVLLIGVETLNSGYNNISYELKKVSKAATETLVLNLNFQLNGAAVMSEATWHILLPKSLEHIPLKINIKKE